MEEILVKQAENKPERDELGRLLPGNTANPHGRPKGQTLKEFQAEQFRQMSNEEKAEWLKDVAKPEKWRMAEGNPKQDTELGGEVKMINVVVPAPVAKAFQINGTNPETGGSNPQQV